MYCYSAFNLTISSPIELPYLPLAETDADIVITLNPRDKHAGPPAAMTQAFHVTPRFATLDYAALGSLIVREGCEVQVTLHPGADERLLPAYLTGPALAVLLYQRGLLVLQASAVLMHNEAVLLMASGGGGKSTLAARLCRHGHSLLADDIAVIAMQDGRAQLIPAAPVLRLDAQAAATLGYRPTWPGGEPGRRDGKGLVMLERRYVEVAVPLRMVYHLRQGPDNNIGYIPLQAALMAVTYHSYPTCLMQPSGIDNLRQCSRLVGAVTVCEFTRRAVLSELAEQAQMIEGHLARQPSIVS